jgi:serine/threonine protein kinase
MTQSRVDTEKLKKFSLGLLGEEESTLLEGMLGADEAEIQWDSLGEVSDELTNTLRDAKTIQITPEVRELMTALREMRPRPEPSTETSITELLDPAKEKDEIGRVDKYKVLRVVGHGGMGVVFEAYDTVLQRKVALKFLLDSRLINPSHVARLAREATALAHLSHSGIVSIYEVGQHRGRMYLALEYLPGGTLAKRLGNEKYSVRESARLVQLLARAAHFAHTNGLVHRDLKPSNILFATSGLESAKIADFGLARRFDEIGLTETGTLLGTPGYLAPELIDTKSDTAKPTGDIYSLGAILYELLTGRPPFRGQTVFEILNETRKGPPEPPSRLRKELPSDLETIVLKCLQSTPSARYQSVEELADDIDRFLSGHPIKAKPTSFIERLRLWAKRDPAATALVIVSLISVLVLSTMQYRTQKALSLVSQKEIESNAARQRADKNYLAARNSIQQMLSRTKEPGSSEIPKLRELQRNLLNDALDFYNGIAKQPATTAIVKRDIVLATYEAATIHARLDEDDIAKKMFEKTIELRYQYCSEVPGDMEILRLKIDALSGITTVSADRTRELLEEAIQLGNELLVEYPNDSLTFGSLAVVWNNFAYFHYHKREFEKAAELFQRSIETREKQLAQEPENRKGLIALASTCSNLQQTLSVLGKEGGNVYAERAAKILEELFADDPGDTFVACRLAGQRTNYSYVLARNGKEDLAIQQLSQSIETLESMIAKDPTDSDLTNTLYNTHGARAEICEAFAKYDTSIASWHRVLDLVPTSQAFDRRVRLVRVLESSNRNNEALSEIEKLIELQRREPSAKRLITIATHLAKCGQSDRAMEQLVDAKKISSATDWTALASQIVSAPEFDPLKSHAQWKELIESAVTQEDNN